MSGFSGLDLDAFAEATIDARADIAADIVAAVKDHYPSAEVVIDGDTVSATTYGSFDHLKEWGSVNNRPFGFMRSAAAAEGNYHPEGK